MKIAIAGKGGTGKTTFTALLMRYLIEKGETPILAVDADPNANLNEALGLEIDISIAEILSNFLDHKDAVPAGMSKEKYVQYQIQSSLVEDKNIDLLVMGGPDGPGCYCYPNRLLKTHIDRLNSNYRHIIMDNEAGLEHLSRRTTDDIQHLFIISDGTARGIRSAGRVKQIVEGIDLGVEKVHLILNKTTPEEKEVLVAEIEKTGLEVKGIIPRDQELVEYDLHGKALFDLTDDSPAVQACATFIKDIL